MKKLLFLMAMSAVSFLSQAQTSSTADRIIARQSFYLKDRWLDGVKVDTSAMTSDNMLLTANAIRRFVEGRIGAIPVKPYIDTVYKRNDSLFLKKAGQEFFVAKDISWSGLQGKPSEFAPSAGSGYYLRNQFSSAQATTSAWISGDFKADNSVTGAKVTIGGTGNGSVGISGNTEGSVTYNGVKMLQFDGSYTYIQNKPLYLNGVPLQLGNFTSDPSTGLSNGQVIFNSTASAFKGYAGSWKTFLTDASVTNGLSYSNGSILLGGALTQSTAISFNNNTAGKDYSFQIGDVQGGNYGITIFGSNNSSYLAQTDRKSVTLAGGVRVSGGGGISTAGGIFKTYANGYQYGTRDIDNVIKGAFSADWTNGSFGNWAGEGVFNGLFTKVRSPNAYSGIEPISIIRADSIFLDTGQFRNTAQAVYGFKWRLGGNKKTLGGAGTLAEYGIYLGTGQAYIKESAQIDSVLQVGRLTAPSVPTGTHGNAGSLSGSYYAKIVAVDWEGYPTEGGTQYSWNSNGTTQTSFTLNWPAVQGAASYRVYVGQVNGNQDRYWTTTGTSFTLTTYGSGDGSISGYVPAMNTSANVRIKSDVASFNVPVIMAKQNTPSSSSDATAPAKSFWFDDNFLYYKTSTGVIKRVPLESF